MARNRRGKQKHKSRKERNVTSYVTDDRDFSGRLSRVLDNEVNENLMQFKRKTMFSYENDMTLTHNAFGHNRRAYIFGSQIEVTTTIGMMSDTDVLHRFDTFRLFLDLENPPLQPHNHQVVLKVCTNGCASQYCVLTMIDPSTQARRFQQMDLTRNPVDIVRFFGNDWTTTGGMIPHTIIFNTMNRHPVMLKQTKIHGPAEIFGDVDSVHACYCKTCPMRCKFVFERPRPGHWPSENTLKKAKKYGVFIIPQGPPKNTNICTCDYFEYQWRISTNLTERLFMFSLDTVHLKAFVLTKMIRKEMFAPEYQDRLSTFHFKTAFFFAVENTRPDVWREDNLINCVKYILATLKRFLTRHNCPHFTIENVNLFDGKIDRHEFPTLVDKLTYIINSLRAKIESIQMDNIGKRLNKSSARQNGQSRYCSYNTALFNYVFFTCHGELFAFEGLKLSETPVIYRKKYYELKYTLLQKYSRAPLGKYRKYDYVFHSVMSELASRLATVYLEENVEGHEYNQDGISKVRQMYTLSLESAIIGNHMRYASFLFCNREYDEACKLFDLIENLIQEDTKSNLVYQLFVSPTESLALQITKQSFEKTSKQIASVFLIFSQEEAMCVSAFMRCEMYRGRFCNFPSSDVRSYNYFDDTSVQIEPYLYYLQYLTYRELHQEPKQSEALMKLLMFTEIIKSTRFITIKNHDVAWGFFDKSLHMLGHCLELEYKLESAWKTYKTSLQLQPKVNASTLHLARLLWQVVHNLRT